MAVETKELYSRPQWGQVVSCRDATTGEVFVRHIGWDDDQTETGERCTSSDSEAGSGTALVVAAIVASSTLIRSKPTSENDWMRRRERIPTS